MASEVKTNKVSPVGTTLSVGDSGDTLALAVDAVTGLKVGSDAAGDILYYDGTDYTRREKPGTPADEVLTFATGATAPTWVAAAAGGSLVFISKLTLPTSGSAAYVDFLNCFTSTYRNYAIMFDNLHASTDGALQIITGDATMSGTPESWTWGQGLYSAVYGAFTYSNSDSGGASFVGRQKGGGADCEGASGFDLTEANLSCFAASSAVGSGRGGSTKWNVPSYVPPIRASTVASISSEPSTENSV